MLVGVSRCTSGEERAQGRRYLTLPGSTLNSLACLATVRPAWAAAAWENGWGRKREGGERGEYFGDILIRENMERAGDLKLNSSCLEVKDPVFVFIFYSVPANHSLKPFPSMMFFSSVCFTLGFHRSVSSSKPLSPSPPQQSEWSCIIHRICVSTQSVLRLLPEPGRAVLTCTCSLFLYIW